VSQSPPDDFPPDDATIPTPPAIPPAYADDDADALRDWIIDQASEFRRLTTKAAARRGERLPPAGPLLPRELMPRPPRGPRGGSLTRAEFIARSDAAYVDARRQFHGREPSQADIADRVALGLRQWRRKAQEFGYHKPPA
jgi:hypothetical protein